jgi:hypothetical protein
MAHDLRRAARFFAVVIHARAAAEVPPVLLVAWRPD